MYLIIFPHRALLIVISKNFSSRVLAELFRIHSTLSRFSILISTYHLLLVSLLGLLLLNEAAALILVECLIVLGWLLGLLLLIWLPVSAAAYSIGARANRWRLRIGVDLWRHWLVDRLVAICVSSQIGVLPHILILSLELLIWGVVLARRSRESKVISILIFIIGVTERNSSKLSARVLFLVHTFSILRNRILIASKLRSVKILL